MKKEAILIALITVVAVMLLAFDFAVIFFGALTAFVQVLYGRYSTCSISSSARGIASTISTL
jgi:hypothetical protein